MRRTFTSVLCLLLVFSLASCGGTEQQAPPTPSESTQVPNQNITAPADGASPGIAPPEEFVLISGGTFQMGSPESEAWRVEDETAHTVKVSDYYISKRGIAEEIQRQTRADLFEIEMVMPYSTDYNTVLDQAQEAQNNQDRPELSTHVEDMSQYDTIILGYPNWWASIPMPVASFLEEYDFTGKTVIPFCSHGGGRFGQSLTAITKLVPDAVLGEGLAVSYSGGSSLSSDVTAWLEENNIPAN